MTAKPRKMEQYLANGERLVAAVNAYRAARDEASAEAPVTQPAFECVECNKPTDTQRTYVSPECNKPKFTDLRKSYRLPPLATPSEIPGYPLNNPSPAQEIPDYGTIGRVKAIRATQAARRGKKAPLAPSGSPALRKRHDVRAWKVAE